MNKLYNIKILGLLFLVSGCTSIGHEFCTNSGYIEDSAGYNLCASRYEASADLYVYCRNQHGLVAESPGLNQCVADARNLRDRFSQEAAFCRQEAERHFSPAFQQPKLEKQATLMPNGDLAVNNLPLSTYYNSSEQDSIAAPFTNSCLQAHGWHNGTWQGGRREASIKEITSALSGLNKEPLLFSVPENPSVRMLSAAAEGNVSAVRDIVNRERMNVNIQNHQGYSALHVAARRGNFQVVRALLEELGADVSITSSIGENAITLAHYGRQDAIVYYINEFIRKKEEDRRRKEIEEHRRKEEERRQKEKEEQQRQLLEKIKQEQLLLEKTKQEAPLPEKQGM